MQFPHGTCDAWNDGTPGHLLFGPIVRGNGLAVYDENSRNWKLVNVDAANFIRANINGCWLDRGDGSGPQPGQVLDVGVEYLISTRLNSDSGDIDIMFTPLSLGYVRSDAEVGIMRAPGDRKWAVTGMCYRHPRYGIQGQANSQYLIGRHTLWTVGLVSIPAFPAPHYFPANNSWIPVGDPIEFCTWADRLPLSCEADVNFFSDTPGATVAATIAINGGALGQFVGVNTCVTPDGPTPVHVGMGFSGGEHDGFRSLQLCVRSNVGNPRVGYAWNSSFRAGIWF